MRRTPAKRVEENDVHEGVPPQVKKVEKFLQGDQVPIGGQGNDVPVVPPELSNSDIREALYALARAVTTQGNISMVPRMNVVESTMTSRLRDFVRMNPPIILGSKVGEDSQEFLNGVYKVLRTMGVTFSSVVHLMKGQ
ncbi:hypothetical protein EJD97_020854 [Solanum chilense]|uniref:Gag-pol polyprotein n=1 Tax=Solanum chilense TaxID=4083 RepID=A0A6N2AYS9_SOLCI|nr:hypothetical protein EJD97_020854 [Solanum chilense]